MRRQREWTADMRSSNRARLKFLFYNMVSSSRSMLGWRIKPTFFLLKLPLLVLEVIKQADSSNHEQRRSSWREHLQDRTRNGLFLSQKRRYAPQ